MHELSVGWLNPLDRDTSHTGRVPRRPGLRDGRLHRQHLVLRHRFGPGPRLHALPGFHLPRAHGARRWRCWSSGSWRVSGGRLVHGGLAVESSGLCALCAGGSGSRSTPIARGPRWSIASSSTGCRVGTQPARPFFAFLNYSDAHAPYQLPPGRRPSVRRRADDERQRVR